VTARAGPASRSAVLRARGVALVRTARGSAFVRHVTLLMTGTAVAHLVTVLATPLLTRLYTPSDYGINAAYLAAVSVLGPMAALRYDFAIVAARDKRDAVLLRGLAMHLVALAAVLTFGLIAGLHWIGGGNLLRHLGALAWLLPLSVLAAGAVVVLGSVLNRRQDYPGMVRGKLVAAWTSALAPIVWFAAVHRSTPEALIVGGLAGTTAAALLLTLRLGPERLLPRVRWARYRVTARRYARFVRFNLVITGIDQLSAGIPLWVLNDHGSTAIGAQFALANNMLRLPGVLVGQAVGQVMYEHAARLRASPEEVAALVRRNVLVLSLLALIPLAVVMAAGPDLFALVFGAEWRIAGEYGRLLMPAVAVWFVASPLTLVPTATGHQDVLLRFISLNAVLRLGGLAIGLRQDSPGLAVLLLGAGEAASGIAFLIWLWRASARDGLAATP